MKLIHYKVEGSQEKSVWLFGVGLIGSEIYKKIKEKCVVNVQDFRVSWGRNDVLSEFIELLKFNSNTREVTIIWSAGRVGFSSLSEEADEEYFFFESFVKIIISLELRVNFFFISSGGALYEGCLNIDYDTELNIDSYYGELKFRQEKFLIENKSFFHSLSIFRPSSVYGYISSTNRMTLIPTIVRNALLRKETWLFGHMYTLRDYVWVGDVAEVIIKFLLLSYNRPHLQILATAKPTSIFEVMRNAEIIMGRKVLFNISPILSNTRDITFSEKVRISSMCSIVEGLNKILLSSCDLNRYSH